MKEQLFVQTDLNGHWSAAPAAAATWPTRQVDLSPQRTATCNSPRLQAEDGITASQPAGSLHAAEQDCAPQAAKPSTPPTVVYFITNRLLGLII